MLFYMKQKGVLYWDRRTLQGATENLGCATKICVAFLYLFTTSPPVNFNSRCYNNSQPIVIPPVRQCNLSLNMNVPQFRHGDIV